VYEHFTTKLPDKLKKEQSFDINKDLSDVLKQYIKHYKLQENNIIFRIFKQIQQDVIHMQLLVK
jgi:hypothetical protein